MIALLYHDVVAHGDYASSGFSGRDADIYKFDCEEFAAHVDAIGEAIEPSRVVVLDGNTKPAIANPLVLTFDDGGAGALLAADLLERHGWRGHFFVTTNWIGKPAFLGPTDIRDLHRRGHVIGSHSCSHPARMSHCSVSELKREWHDSAGALEDICGTPVRVASVPGGYFGMSVAEAAAEAGIRVLFNSEPTTQAANVRGCMVVGRYSIQQGVAAATAASIASGQWRPRMKQFLFWNAKKIAKRVGGEYYIAMRKSLLNRRRTA